MLIYSYSNRRNNSIVEQRLDNSIRLPREPEFQTTIIFEAYDQSLPHRGCTLFDGAVSDNRLRRSEVYCAAALMAAGLNRNQKFGDRIVPVRILFCSNDRLDADFARQVFIYSFSGYQGRVIQAHYEHPHFIIRKTNHFLFEDGSSSGFKQMLR